MPNPQQINANITKKMKDINPLNKLTTPPDPMAKIKEQKPEYAWEIELMKKSCIFLLFPL